jgi:hypothetical protein
VKAETKEQSKWWMNTHSPNKQKKFTYILFACQEVDGNPFLGQERSADGGIHAARNHKNDEVYCKTLNRGGGMLTVLQCSSMTMHTLEHCWVACPPFLQA